MSKHDIQTRTSSPIIRKIAPFAALGILGLLVVGAVNSEYIGVPSFQYVDKTNFSHGPRVDMESQGIDLSSSVRRAWKNAVKKTSGARKTTKGVRNTTLVSAQETPPAETVTGGAVSTENTGGGAPVASGVISVNTSLSSVAPAFGIAAGGGLVSLSEGDLDMYFQSLNSLGVSWVRWDVNWRSVQEERSDVYHWDDPDRISGEAKKYNVKSLGILTYAPYWALSAPCVSAKTCAPVDPATFAHFAGLAAARYKGTIDYWEIWNEPNTHQDEYPRPNVVQYATLLKETYAAIKKANPNAVVIVGGLAPAADDSDGNISPVTFIQGLYDSGVKDSFDAIALHPYTYPGAPDYVCEWNNWDQMYTIRNIMIKNGDTAKKIWLTEYGAPTGGPGRARTVNDYSFVYGADYMSESAQTQLVRRVTEMYAADTTTFGPFFWYSLWDNGTSKSTPENFFGLLRHDWSKKPAYDTFKSAVSAMNAAQ
ncbi:MAG: glycoside hydrolase family 5 protein [Candidatus Yonathbacteria bacterium]|nr:glycoside hydrolase family 5 protein [Candidatus Yonathbacteria bacterium]